MFKGSVADMLTATALESATDMVSESVFANCAVVAEASATEIVIESTRERVDELVEASDTARLRLSLAATATVCDNALASDTEIARLSVTLTLTFGLEVSAILMLMASILENVDDDV